MFDLLARLFVRDYKNVNDPTVRRAYGMLVSIVGAVSSADFSFEIKESSLSASAVETELALSEYQAEYICHALLSEEGIKYEKIKARATKTEDGGIIINEIILNINNNKLLNDKTFFLISIIFKIKIPIIIQIK